MIEMLANLDIARSNKSKDIEYISELNKNYDKVNYLRNIKKYTQADTAELIGISLRQVQRIDKKLRDKKL